MTPLQEFAATMEEKVLSHLGRRCEEELRVVTSLLKERLPENEAKGREKHN